MNQWWPNPLEPGQLHVREGQLHVHEVVKREAIRQPIPQGHLSSAARA